jgi:DNA-binding CsgD family transcriptional regulator/tetratricopeptide (TPR) repeat protein
MVGVAPPAIGLGPHPLDLSASFRGIAYLRRVATPCSYDQRAVVGVDTSPVFVGRSIELELLSAALARAATDVPSVIIVGGEGGAGKTRLVHEFAIRADAGVTVLIGRCFPAHGHGLPYSAFADLFRDLQERLPPDRLTTVLRPARAGLALVVPELERGASRDAADGVIEMRALSRARLFELVLGVADRLQQAGPVVIAIEDLQWADVATLDLLAFLVRGIKRGRIILVLTIRTDDLGTDHRTMSAVAELERGSSVQRLELGRLSKAEVAAQLAGILDSTPSTALVERVASRSDGNPFLVEELLAAERRGQGAELSPKLEDLLGSRLATVSDATRRVLRAAAVVGTEIDDGLVATALGVPAPEVADALREATQRGLVTRGAGSRTGHRFRHALLREFIEDGLLPEERRRLHQACAEAFAASSQAPHIAGEIARHWLLAGRSDRALPAAIAAGLDAERRVAFADARRFFDTAVVLWDEVGPPSGEIVLDRPDLLLHDAEVSALSGDPSAAVELARRAVGEIDPEGDPRLAGAFHDRLFWFLWGAGQHEQAMEALDQASRLVPVDPPSTLRARVLAHLGGVRLRQERFAESAALADEAINVARAAGALSELAFGLGVRAWDRASLGRPIEGLTDVREAVAISELLEGPEGRAVAVTNLSSLLLYTGHLEEALVAARDGLAVVRSVGLDQTYGATLASTAAAACYRLGRWSDAREYCRLALEAVPPGPDGLWTGAVAARLGAASGDRALTQRGLDLAGSSLMSAIDRVQLGWYRAGLVEAALADDEPERAIAFAAGDPGEMGAIVLDEPAASIAALGIRAAADLADLSRGAGDEAAMRTARESAEAILAGWRDRWQRVNGASPDPTYVAAADRLCHAEATRAAGINDADAWQEAADAFEGIGAAYPAAYARFREAEALLGPDAHDHARTRRQARSTAAAPLRRALESSRKLGAGPLSEAIELLAGRARLDVDPAVARVEPVGPTGERPAGPMDRASSLIERRGLTHREVEVLTLVGAGWSNGEIANALFISRKTASVHVSNILGKLGAPDRIEAAAVAQRAGLVGPPRPTAILAGFDQGEGRPSRD